MEREREEEKRRERELKSEITPPEVHVPHFKTEGGVHWDFPLSFTGGRYLRKHHSCHNNIDKCP